MSGICFHCGGPLAVDGERNEIYYFRVVDGNDVKVHKSCAKNFDLEEAATKVTARERESVSRIVDEDKLAINPNVYMLPRAYEK